MHDHACMELVDHQEARELPEAVFHHILDLAVQDARLSGSSADVEVLLLVCRSAR